MNTATMCMRVYVNVRVCVFSGTTHETGDNNESSFILNGLVGSSIQTPSKWANLNLVLDS